MSAVKMLVVDRDTLLVRHLTEHLRVNGFDCRQATDVKEAKKMMNEWVPDILLAELALADGTALDIIAHVRTSAFLARQAIRIAVMSAHSKQENVRTVFAAGAVDYLVKPLKIETVIPRFAFFLQEKKSLEEFKKNQEKQDGGDYYLNLVELVLREANAGRHPRQTLFNLTKMLGMILGAVRCSIIETDRQTFNGLVKVSNDDYKVTDLKIDLNKYPEVLYVMNKEQMVAVENIELNPVLAEIKKHVQTIQFNAMIVCPIKKNGKFYGVISVRLGSRTQPFSERELRFAQLISQVASLVISTSENNVVAPAEPAGSSDPAGGSSDPTAA